MLTTTAPVAARNRGLRIDAVAEFAREHRDTPRLAQYSLHCTALADNAFLHYLLVLETLNFFFWDEEPRRRMEYRGGSHYGYWTLPAGGMRSAPSRRRPWQSRI